MRYYVTFEESEPPVVVDVVELPSGALDVRVGGQKVDVDVVAVPGSWQREALSVRTDGRLVDITTEGAPPDVGVVGSGLRAYVRVESERMRAADQAHRGKAGLGEKVVKSPMPGRVVKLHVAPGDEIAAGQPLLVVEAMKMENEIRAKAPGKVDAIHVKVGEPVEVSGKLITLA